MNTILARMRTENQKRIPTIRTLAMISVISNLKFN